jgi:carbon storage regulator CsrA
MVSTGSWTELRPHWPKTAGVNLGAKDEDAGHVGTASSGLAIRYENGGSTMLVLSRKTEESVVVGGHERFEPILRVTVLAIDGGRVSLGFEASEDVPVHRWEVWERIRTSGRLEVLV